MQTGKMPNGNEYMIIGDDTVIWNKCKVDKKDYSCKVRTESFIDVLAGEDIHTVFPEISKYVRNFIETGFTPREQTYIFDKPNINWDLKDPKKNKINLLDIAINSVIDASDYMMNIYNKYEKIDVTYKSKYQPLTKADIGSHNHILGYLKAHTPFFALSEECDERYHKQITDHESFWLIDPLDGTKDFIKKNGEFSILISFIHKGEPIVGVMYFPVKDELYFACKGSPAWKIKDFKSIVKKRGIKNALNKMSILKLQCTESDKLILLSSRSHRTEELDSYIGNIGKLGYTIEEKQVGAAIKFANILENKADIYARICKNGKCPSQWDIAAAHCIIKAAGGEVLNLDTRNELTYGHAELKLKSFIIKHPKLKV